MRRGKTDGLRLSWQADFVRTNLPTLITLIPAYANLSLSLSQVKVSQQGLAYGLRAGEFDESIWTVNDSLCQYDTL